METTSDERSGLLSASIQVHEGDRHASLDKVGYGATGSPTEVAEKKTHVFNIYVLSLGFLLLFAAYNTLQNYVTSLLPGNLGNESLSVLYCSVCVCVFFAPSIASRMGERATMVLGAACYVVYMISLIEVHRACVCALLGRARVGAGMGSPNVARALGSERHEHGSTLLTHVLADHPLGRTPALRRHWCVHRVFRLGA
jgi:hypothetical protein